jgi:hypothetical protein
VLRAAHSAPSAFIAELKRSAKNMKTEIRRQNPEDLVKTYPIQNKVDGWFFRVEEVSNCVYEVEGSDLYGRKVFRSGSDPDSLLVRCAEDARLIIEQLQT